MSASCWTASLKGNGATNEDAVRTGTGWALVLDGATAPSGETGCIHGVRWLVDHLADDLAARLNTDDAPLADLLAASIKITTGEHADTCDVSHPSTPSSTVALVRERGDQLDYLVLADSPVVLDLDGEITPIIDSRVDHLPDYRPETVARVRNTTAGFWVASTNPEAAHQAVSGSVPLDQVRRAVLATDGATRLVDVFGDLSWSELVDLCTRPDGTGPDALLRLTRDTECGVTDKIWRGKFHDDATVVALDWRDAR